jgi:hypothetical protein
VSLFGSDAEGPQILPLSCGGKGRSDDDEKRAENILKGRAKIEHFSASICIHRRLFLLYYLIVNKNKQSTAGAGQQSGSRGGKKRSEDKAHSKKRKDKKRKQTGQKAGETGWITIPENGSKS